MPGATRSHRMESRLPGVNGKVAVYIHPPDVVPRPVDRPARLRPLRLRPADGRGGGQHGGEGTPASAIEILDDLLMPASDILLVPASTNRPRRRAPCRWTRDSSLAGARKALLASACSVIQPQPFHPRLSRAEAEQLVRSSTLGQTERGSFTAVISCPLEAERPTSPRGANPPHVRDVRRPGHQSGPDLRLGIRARWPVHPPGDQPPDAVRRPITSASDPDEPPTPCSIPRGRDAPQFHPLRALLAMQPVGDRSRLSLAATRSRSLTPPPSATPPRLWSFAGSTSPAIESLAVKLRPVAASRSFPTSSGWWIRLRQPGRRRATSGERFSPHLQPEETIRQSRSTPTNTGRPWRPTVPVVAPSTGSSTGVTASTGSSRSRTSNRSVIELVQRGSRGEPPTRSGPARIGVTTLVRNAISTLVLPRKRTIPGSLQRIRRPPDERGPGRRRGGGHASRRASREWESGSLHRLDSHRFAFRITRKTSLIGVTTSCSSSGGSGR